MIYKEVGVKKANRDVTMLQKERCSQEEKINVVIEVVQVEWW